MTFVFPETFTFKSGAKFEGTFVKVDERTNVVVKGKEGKLYNLPFAQLDSATQRDVQKMKAKPTDAWKTDAQWLRLEREIQSLKSRLQVLAQESRHLNEIMSAKRRAAQSYSREKAQDAAIGEETRKIHRQIASLQAQQLEIEHLVANGNNKTSPSAPARMSK